MVMDLPHPSHKGFLVADQDGGGFKRGRHERGARMGKMMVQRSRGIPESLKVFRRDIRNHVSSASSGPPENFVESLVRKPSAVESSGANARYPFLLTDSKHTIGPADGHAGIPSATAEADDKLGLRILCVLQASTASPA
jgi:hypothetical protein